MNELVDVLALRQVAQADAAEIAQRNPRRQAFANVVDDGLGQQYLATVCRTHDSRRAVDRAAKEVAVPLLDDAQVQPAAHTERYPVGGFRVAKRLLQRKRGVYTRPADRRRRHRFRRRSS